MNDQDQKQQQKFGDGTIIGGPPKPVQKTWGDDEKEGAVWDDGSTWDDEPTQADKETK